jgi:hypothetical protein
MLTGLYTFVPLYHLPASPKSAAPMLIACLEPLAEVPGGFPELRELRLLVDERDEVGRDDTVDR